MSKDTEKKQQPGTGGGAADTGAAASDKSKSDGGDLSVALKQEREERKRLREENDTLQEQLKSLKQDKETSGAAGDLDLGKYEISEDDIIEGNAKALNDKLRGAIQQVYRQTRQDLDRQLTSKQTAQTVDNIMGEFSIFADEDKELQTDATSAALKAVKKLPDGYSPDDLRGALKSVAERYSRYKVARTGDGEDGGEGDDTGPVGSPPDAGASHMDRDEPPKNMREAKKLGDKVLKRFMKNRQQ